MFAFKTQRNIALFRHQLLDLRIDRVIVRASNINGLGACVLGLSMDSKTCQCLCRKLADRPSGNLGSAIAVKGPFRQFRFQPEVVAFDLNRVVEERANTNSSRRICGTLARSGHQSGHVDAPLEIRNT